MHSTKTFHCPSCNQRFGANDELIGKFFDCPTCDTQLQIPSAGALAAIPQPIAPLPLDDVPARKRRRLGTKPVEMRLPGQLGSLKAQVDQPTSNAIATTFLGGLLVALGAFLFAGFMGKGKSS